MNIALFGATGSIGASTLDVVARHPGRYRVSALTANDSADALLELFHLLADLREVLHQTRELAELFEHGTHSG